MEENKKLRQLETRDIFLITRVIGKIGIKNFKECFKNEELKVLVNNANGEIDLTQIGMFAAFDVVDVLFENLPRCEDELYKLLANLANVLPQQIGEQPPADTMEMVIELIHDPRFMDFFKVALRLFKNTKTM